MPRQPRPTNTGYIPSLDGWRAVAIFGVLMVHSLPWTIAGHSLRPLQDVGGKGVQLFFAISGLLITSRILEEERVAGHFSLKRFYIRRFFRIQPAAFVYLGVIAFLLAFGVIPGEWFFWFAALFLFGNYAYSGIPVDPGSFFVGHFWSLAVEEHFYLLLSTFLFAVRRYRLAILLGLYVSLFAAERHFWPYLLRHPESLRRTQWQLRFLVLPSAMAVALTKLQVRRWVERWVRPWVVISAWLMLLGLHRFAVHYRHPAQPLASIQAVSSESSYFVEVIFTLLVTSTALHPKSLLSRALELSVPRWIGRISYSLYLWHVLFFSRLAEPQMIIRNPVLHLLSSTPLKYAMSLLAAALSYYAIEKRFMRLGHRLAPPSSPGRPELAETGAASAVAA